MKYALTLLCALAIAGCAGVPVRTDHDADTRFETFRNFAWLEPAHDQVADPVLDSQLLGTKVRRAAVANLTARGYREVPADRADFLVTYHTASRERMRDSNVTIGWGFGRGYYHRGHRSIWVDQTYWNDSFQEGTLMLDVIDASSNRLVWRGWVSTRVHRDSFTDAAVERAVSDILARFPPG